METPIMDPKDSPENKIGHDSQEGIHLVIIGAGLAGLAAALSTKLANPAHKVTICEAVSEIHEIGSGLQITPNGTRLLSHWGLTPSLSPLAAIPQSLSVHRYDGTKLLAHEPNLQSQATTRYGHPFWDLHRVDLQNSLVTRCLSLGVTLLFNSGVVTVDFDTPSVALYSGRTIHADIILLADGLYSTIRSQFLGKPSPPTPTGDLVYRLTIHTDDIPSTHPYRDELLSFIQNPTVNFWIGPNSHAAGYSVSSKIYNIVLLTPSPFISPHPSQIPQLFTNWAPILQKLISTLPRQTTTNNKTPITKFNLQTLNPSMLPSWTNPRGTFFLSGDACHPMVPFLAQGANTALEDGAVLGHLLSKVSCPSQLPRLGEMYSRLRRGRCVRVYEESVKQGVDFHMVDGKEQERRDGLMMIGEAPFSSRWTCPETQAFLWGYDAYGEAEKAWRGDPF